MLNLHPEHYDQWPYVRRAVAYLKAAKLLYEPANREGEWWVASYYLLSHAMELAIKGVANLKTGKEPWGHDKQHLSETYRKECGFSDTEMEAIRQLKKLNSGPGGLRYDNQLEADFLPSIFNDSVQVIERLIIENFQ